MNESAEITWSLMHPTTIDAGYMSRIIGEASRYDFDSFEICGACSSPFSGLNGLLLLEPYPAAHAQCDQEKIHKTRAVLSEIVSLAGKIGKPLYLWHREIMMPKGMLQDRPALLDENGEFDLLGKDFEEFLRYKIDNAFKVVPALGGVVLTLTEADFSVIHNSDPDRYPPDKVVEKIVRIFAEEHEKRGKRFILRSFGSIAADYEDILRGARAAAADHHFDIETKITPYDFTPFLPTNPFLKQQPNTSLNAECDGLGEYLGAGYLPAAAVDLIARYVRDGRDAGVKRYAIRLDRIGNSVFDSHEINLYAYQRMIRDPKCTADDVYREWAANHWQGCEEEMVSLARLGLDAVKKTNFICGNVVFHIFPILPDFKWITAGGSIGVYSNHVSLHQLRGCWGILSDHNSPGRDVIRAEKRDAAAMAEEGLMRLQKLKGKLTDFEYNRTERVWKILNIAVTAIRAYTEALCCYFDDLDAGHQEPVLLKEAAASAEKVITALLHDKSEKLPTLAGCSEGTALPGDDLDRVYLKSLRFLCREILLQYRAEFDLRAKKKEADVLDIVLPGSFGDQYRVYRYMHASHSSLVDGVPVRYAGNPVFPNGFIELELSCTAGGKIEIELLPGQVSEMKLTLNGTQTKETVSRNGIVICKAPAEHVTLRIEKSGCEYPPVVLVRTFRSK